MSRIQGVPEKDAGWLARVAYRESKKKLGKIAEPIAVTAHHSWILGGYGAYEMALERARKVDAKLKGLAELKVASVVGCRFCIDIGSAINRNLGVSEEQLRDLPIFEKSAKFDETEKLVLTYAERMTETPVKISEELFAALRRKFDEAQIVELTAAIAWENYRARFNHALGIEEQGFYEGQSCLLPERPMAAHG